MPLKCNHNTERWWRCRERCQNVALSDSYVERNSTKNRVIDAMSHNRYSLDSECKDLKAHVTSKECACKTCVTKEERVRKTCVTKEEQVPKARVLTHGVVSQPTNARPLAPASKLSKQP